MVHECMPGMRISYERRSMAAEMPVRAGALVRNAGNAGEEEKKQRPATRSTNLPIKWVDQLSVPPTLLHNADLIV